MNYIDEFITQALDFIANYNYEKLAAKAIFKTAEFIIENGIDIIQWVNR